MPSIFAMAYANSYALFSWKMTNFGRVHTPLNAPAKILAEKNTLTRICSS